MLQTAANAEPAQQTLSQPPTLNPADYRGFVDDPDAVLVRSFRSGDAFAFELLVRRHEQRLLNVARSITKNREDAEDVVQDSFLKAFKHLDSFRGDSRFSSWLTRITINQALMRKRGWRPNTIAIDECGESRRGITICELKANNSTPEELCARREFERLLLDWTSDISEASKRVLKLHAFEQLPDAQIAQLLGITQSAVKARLFRLRRELRKKVDRLRRSAEYFGNVRTKQNRFHCRGLFALSRSGKLI